MDANTMTTDPSPPRQGMSTAAKVVLGLLVFLFFLAICALIFAITVASVIGFSVARSVEKQPVQVTNVANDIAEFDLPPGYDDSWAINGFGFALVGYEGADTRSHIMLAQIPSWVQVDTVELEREARRAAQGEVNVWENEYRFEVIDERAVTIRGQETTMTVGEGTSSNGDRYREVIVPFQGEGGQALLIVVAPIEVWDQAQIDAFLASFE